MCKCELKVHEWISTLQSYASAPYTSRAVSFFLYGSLLFLYLCLLSPPSPLPLPWMAGQAVSCAGSEEVRTPWCTLIMKGLSLPPPPLRHTHTHSRTHSANRHGDGTSPALSPGGGGSWEYSYTLQPSARQADHELVHKPTILGHPPWIFTN